MAASASALSTTSERPPRVLISVPGYCEFKLSPTYCTCDTLSKLIGIDALKGDASPTPLPTPSVLVIDAQTEELDELDCDDSGVYPVVSGRVYTVAFETDLDDSPDGESVDTRTARLIRRAQAIQGARQALIRKHYKPLHPELYGSIEGQEQDMFTPAFLSIVHAARGNSSSKPEAVLAQLVSLGLKRETETGLWSFDMLQPQWCARYIAELMHFERSGLPLSTPNSMNNYGLILQDLGLEGWFDELRDAYLQPVSQVLFGEIASGLDSHHAFIVEYRLSEDTKLDFHVDDSEVTLNVCLGHIFEGGELYFQGLFDDKRTHKENFVIVHRLGRGLLHIGRHRHGAMPITSGERVNLIVWLRSSSWRQHQPKEQHQHEHDCSGCSQDEHSAHLSSDGEED